jgi:hypothetical protein
MKFGRDGIYYACQIKNAGGLLDVCEDHLQVYPLTCFSWASHAVVRINNLIRADDRSVAESPVFLRRPWISGGTSFWIFDLMVLVHLLSVIVYHNDKAVRALISNER